MNDPELTGREHFLIKLGMNHLVDSFGKVSQKESHSNRVRSKAARVKGECERIIKKLSRESVDSRG